MNAISENHKYSNHLMRLLKHKKGITNCEYNMFPEYFKLRPQLQTYAILQYAAGVCSHQQHFYSAMNNEYHTINPSVRNVKHSNLSL